MVHYLVKMSPDISSMLMNGRVIGIRLGGQILSHLNFFQRNAGVDRDAVRRDDDIERVLDQRMAGRAAAPGCKREHKKKAKAAHAFILGV